MTGSRVMCFRPFCAERPAANLKVEKTSRKRLFDSDGEGERRCEAGACARQIQGQRSEG